MTEHNTEVVEHTDVESFDQSEYVEMGLVATVKHHKNNGDRERNRHALFFGEDVIVVESKND